MQQLEQASSLLLNRGALLNIFDIIMVLQYNMKFGTWKTAFFYPITSEKTAVNIRTVPTWKEGGNYRPIFCYEVPLKNFVFFSFLPNVAKTVVTFFANTSYVCDCHNQQTKSQSVTLLRKCPGQRKTQSTTEITFTFL